MEFDKSRCLPIAEDFLKTETQWAYLAGIIDGEGCISLHMGSNGYPHPRVQIANNRIELHDWLSKHFYFKTLATNNRSNCFTTHCAESSHIKWLLENTLPFYVIKREQAELLLEYVANSQGQGRKNLTPAERILEIMARLKILHHRERRSE